MESEVFADQWIPLRPHTDVPLLLAIMNVLFKDDSYDKDFIAKQVEPTGFQKWKDYVLGKTAPTPPPTDPVGSIMYGIGDSMPGIVDGAVDRTPEWAEKITGVPADTIRGLARFLAQNKGKIALQFGLGFQRRQYGEDACGAAIMLTCMLGNLGNPGNYGFTTGQGGYPTISRPSTTSYFARKNYTYVVPNTIDVRDNVSTSILLRPLYEQGKITAEEFNHLCGGIWNDPIVNIKMMFYNRGFMTPAVLNNTIRSLKILPYLVWTLGQYTTNVIYNYTGHCNANSNHILRTGKH